MKLLPTAVVLLASMLGGAWAKEIAVCGASKGHAYYPEAGLLAITKSKDAGTWSAEGIGQGQMTLSRSGDALDLFFADALSVRSVRSDGGQVVKLGQTDEAIAVVVNYPDSAVETYTFIKTPKGAEVIWSSNKYGTPLPKIGAYVAPCSFLSLE